MLIDKNVFGGVAVLMNIAATIPYCLQIWRGKVKPHIFTWVIWSLTMSIAAAARQAGDAGPGSWGVWANAGCCVFIVVMSISGGEKKITRSDLVAFIAALSIIPIWQLTDSPLLAVIMVTAIDTLGYYPTARKSYMKPREEMVTMYVLANAVHLFTILANTTTSWTTVLMPAVLLFVNSALVTMIMWRRQNLHQENLTV